MTVFQEELLRKAVQQIELPQPIKVAAISHAGERRVWRSHEHDASDGNDRQEALAEEIVQHVHETWENREGVAEIRFLAPSRGNGGLLLYTQALAVPSYALILAAEPQTSVSTLRTTARELVNAIDQLQRAAPPPEKDVTRLIDREFSEPAAPDSTYAIAWQPRKPIPAALHAPLTQAMERLAGANACQIAYFAVHPRVVQLVVACPPGKNSAWVAHTFKRGSQREIQRQFNIPATLWADGYFARESVQPLEPAELQLFLT